MDVQELDYEQLEELRYNYLWSEENLDGKRMTYEEITDDFLFDVFGAISFVPDDFFCSCGK